MRTGNLFRRGALAAFAKATSGLAALEFALILPIMVVLYLAGFEVSEAFIINRKVTHATSALGDLVAQAEDISDSEMENILDAVEAVMNPYSSSAMWMIVSGVRIDDEGVAEVVWSDARNTTPHAAGSAISIPITILQNETFIVVAEVHYAYVPTFGHALVGTIDLHDDFYLRPRLQNEVERS
jgi:Flp pilus assembly protein TadG